MNKIVPRNYSTYLSLIVGMVDSRAFLRQWADIDGKRTDISRRGAVSCAFFVSFVLSGFGYIAGIHATVSGLERKLLASGWKKIGSPRTGSVIVWETAMHPSGPHAHVGFWISEKVAISNHPTLRVPKRHHPTFGKTKAGNPRRRIVAVYWKPGIDRT